MLLPGQGDRQSRDDRVGEPVLQVKNPVAGFFQSWVSDQLAVPGVEDLDRDLDLAGGLTEGSKDEDLGSELLGELSPILTSEALRKDFKARNALQLFDDLEPVVEVGAETCR